MKYLLPKLFDSSVSSVPPQILGPSAPPVPPKLVHNIIQLSQSQERAPFFFPFLFFFSFFTLFYTFPFVSFLTFSFSFFFLFICF